MLDHVSIQCADVDTSAGFYDDVLASISVARACSTSAASSATAFPERPNFWIGPLTTGEHEPRDPYRLLKRPIAPRCRHSSRPPSPVAPKCCTSRAVWPEYHPNYYGGFVRDPDGNNVEAVCHPPEE